jgi:hypothetical protein
MSVAGLGRSLGRIGARGLVQGWRVRVCVEVSTLRGRAEMTTLFVTTRAILVDLFVHVGINLSRGIRPHGLRTCSGGAGNPRVRGCRPWHSWQSDLTCDRWQKGGVSDAGGSLEGHWQRPPRVGAQCVTVTSKGRPDLVLEIALPLQKSGDRGFPSIRGKTTPALACFEFVTGSNAIEPSVGRKRK